jgi:hypothetical protein
MNGLERLFVCGSSHCRSFRHRSKQMVLDMLKSQRKLLKWLPCLPYCEDLCAGILTNYLTIHHKRRFVGSFCAVYCLHAKFVFTFKFYESGVADTWDESRFEWHDLEETDKKEKLRGFGGEEDFWGGFFEFWLWNKFQLLMIMIDCFEAVWRVKMAIECRVELDRNSTRLVWTSGE